MRQRLTRRAAAAASVAAALGFGAVEPITTASAADTLVAGQLLAQHLQDGPNRFDFDVSPGYVAYNYGPRDDAAPAGTLQIRRISDGSLVRTMPSYQSVDGQSVGAALAGTSYIQASSAAYDGSAASFVDFHDIESGDLLHRFDLAAGEIYLGHGDSWIMTRTPDDTAHLRKLDGSNAVVTTPVYRFSKMLTQDAQAALVVGSTGLISVDLATGAATKVGEYASYDQIFLTPQRILWIESDTDPVLHWENRDGTNPGSIAVTAEGWHKAFLPFGDGLAAFTYAGENNERVMLSAVDEQNGTLGGTIASSVVNVRPAGDGSLVAELADNTGGRLVQLAPGEPARTVVDLPPIAWRASSLHLSGNLVAATWSGSDSWPDRPVELAPADGSGAWTGSFDGTASEPLPNTSALVYGNPDSRTPMLAGDVLLTSTNNADGGSLRYHLKWPGGGRDITGQFITLGHGGQLVARSDGDTTVVEDVRTGERRATFPAGTQPTLDGTWVWTGPDASGTVHGIDSSGQGKAGVSARIASQDCLGSLVDVRGRWALLRSCTGQYAVADLAGGQQTFPTSVFALGNGFVAAIETAANQSTATVVVTDLSPAHTVRRYGPVGTSQQTFLAVDDGPGADLVYTDTQGQLRRVDLEWLGEAAPPSDAAAPILRALTGSGATVAAHSGAATLSFGWSYADAQGQWVAPTGIASYEVRYTNVPHSTAATTWLYPTPWQATTATTVTLPASAGTDTCFQVRARDNAGNLSDWTESRCSTVDGRAPVIQRATIGPRVGATIGPYPVVFRYLAQDDVAVASYETQYRIATAGHDFGAWTTPVTEAQPGEQVRMQVAAGRDVCYRVRARDTAGNVSAWSIPTCSAISVDDRALSASAAVKRVKNSQGLGHTLTTLTKKGSQVSLKLTARQVGIWVWRVPGAGSLDVRFNGKLIGSVKGDYSRPRRMLVLLPTGSSKSGTLTLTSHAKAPVSIDAVAAVRS